MPRFTWMATSAVVSFFLLILGLNLRLVDIDPDTAKFALAIPSVTFGLILVLLGDREGRPHSRNAYIGAGVPLIAYPVGFCFDLPLAEVAIFYMCVSKFLLCLLQGPGEPAPLLQILGRNSLKREAACTFALLAACAPLRGLLYGDGEDFANMLIETPVFTALAAVLLYIPVRWLSPHQLLRFIRH